MKVINEHIKTGSFERVYLIYGEEKYLVRQFKNKLKNAVLGDGDSMNLSVFEGKDVNPGEVIDIAETLPFFAEKRVIVIENSSMFKTGQEVMAAYVKEIPETTCIIFAEEEVDKRSKLYKAVKDNGYVCEMQFQSEKDLFRWVAAQLQDKGKSIEYDAVEYLLTKVGTQMDMLCMEIEKLVSYSAERDRITLHDIDEICSTLVSGKIFDMVEAIGKKQRQKALDMYYDLLVLKEAPLKILALISRHFNILMKVREMSEERVDQALVSKTVGLPSFVVKKYVEQSRAFSRASLKRAVSDCVEIEERIKMGNLNDRLGVELVIIRYSL